MAGGNWNGLKVGNEGIIQRKKKLDLRRVGVELSSERRPPLLSKYLVWIPGSSFLLMQTLADSDEESSASVPATHMEIPVQ